MAKVCSRAGCSRGCYGEFCLLHKPRKHIPQRGKQFNRYEHWKRTVAIPYLDNHYGHICSVLDCAETQVDIDHILTRGAHPELKYNLTNLRYLCRPHHQMVTAGEKVDMKNDSTR